VFEGVDALHAGAAMHCWPDLDSALSEIYRVLKPGGRFFATTFLAPYFRGVQSMSGEDVQQKAFQYFETVDVLKDIVLSGGFQEENIEIEVLGTACVVIKAVK
jgi:ubiquinone/menaquinone biosynthesis C-methylase UbiE